MADMMTFPETVEEFMEQYKITDTEQIYTNGAELVPIFRMKQWFNHKPEQRWVPCEEVEPEEDQECWFTVNDRGFRYVNRGCFTRRYGERRDKGFITAGGFAWWNTAIAWMPIPEPEPYKGETG